MEYRAVWIVEIPGIGRFEAEGSRAISVLQEEGFVTAPSTVQNRENPLTINGTLSNNQATVQCVAVNVSNTLTRYVGETVTMGFYGKHILLVKLLTIAGQNQFYFVMQPYNTVKPCIIGPPLN